MRKSSYYLVLIIIAGAAFVFFWIYQKYIKEEQTSFLLFNVERGAVQEVVKVRGEVAARQEFDLGFPFSGTIEEVFVKEGQTVNRNAPLMKLETTDFELEIKKLEAVFDQKRAVLEKLIAGAAPEDIQVLETKVSNAEVALKESKNNLVDKLRDAFIKSDDAIRSKVDQFFNSPRSSDPKLNFSLADSQLKTDFERERTFVETLLVSWKLETDRLTASDNLASFTDAAKKNLAQIKSFLDKAALILSVITASSNLSQTTIDTYRSDISTARANINTAITNLSAAEEKLRTAESGVFLAQKELAAKKAAARIEDVEIAKAQIREIENQIAITEEKIKKSFIYAPGGAKILKVNFEKQEFYTAGQVAVSLSASDYKIQADVSELEIVKVRDINGNDVLARFDALPGQEFKGKVIFIEPKEIIKEGDKYYRVNVYLDKFTESLRPGMSADLIILISFKDEALKIPELAIYDKGGKKFVKILKDNQQKEIEVETGISDGENVEVISGLVEGQIVIVSQE